MLLLCRFKIRTFTPSSATNMKPSTSEYPHVGVGQVSIGDSALRSYTNRYLHMAGAFTRPAISGPSRMKSFAFQV